MQVYEVSRSSFWVGMLGAVGLVPLIVFGLWGGAIADVVDRRILLIVSSFVLWGCTLALLVQALLGLSSLALLLVLVAFQSAGFAVASSTRSRFTTRTSSASDPSMRRRSKPNETVVPFVPATPMSSSAAEVATTGLPSTLTSSSPTRMSCSAAFDCGSTLTTTGAPSMKRKLIGTG